MESYWREGERGQHAGSGSYPVFFLVVSAITYSYLSLEPMPGHSFQFPCVFIFRLSGRADRLVLRDAALFHYELFDSALPK